MAPRRTPGSPRWVLKVLPATLLLLVMFSALSGSAQDDAGRPVVDPIRIDGNGELDAFFADAGSDGLTPVTAHVLEGITIERADEEDACIHIQNTTRYLIIRNCTVSDVGLESDATAIELISCSNLTVEDCTLPGSRKAIVVLECNNISINENTIRDQSYVGIYLESTDHADVLRNDLDRCNESIIIYRGANNSVKANSVCDNKVGIRVTASRDNVLFDNEVKYSTNGGIKVQRSRRLVIEANYAHDNSLAGIHVSKSEDLEILANRLETNYQGIYLYDLEGCHVLNNNATWNEVVGIRLSGSHGNRIETNFVKSNWNYGVDLVASDGNKISDNRIVSHERGIRLERSRDNTVEDNELFGNWFHGMDGNLDDNTIRNNDMRANGWLRGILFIIVGLIILGGVLGTFFWVRRRRLSREEKGQILIKRRFPSGAKALWPMSRVMWDEDFFNAQLATAGPQREDILRRYQQNIAAAKQMQYMAVGTMAVMLAFMAALPLIGVMNVATTDITTDNVHDVLFASSMGIAVYYLMSFMILLVFGLLFTSQLMKGEIFKLLSTLPMDNKGARRIVAYLLFRMYGPPLVVVLLAFPIGGFLITWSLSFLAVALLVNGLYLVFVTYVLVLIADATSRRIFSANATKGATAMRFLIMAGYLMAMMFMFVTLDFLTTFISDLFQADKLAGGSGEAISMGMSLIPFPFSGSYLISTTFVPGAVMPSNVLATTVIGLVLMVGVVFSMRRTVNKILTRVARGVEHAAGGPGQISTVEDIVIRTRRPRFAFMRNGLTVTSRDQGAIMYIIMPLLFPLIIVIPMSGEGITGTYEPLVPFLMYMGIMSFLVNMALSSGDATVGGLLGSLPFRVLDQYRAKWLTVVMITLVPVVVITVAMYNVVVEPVKMVALMVSLVPLLMVLGSLYLITFSLAFGTVNGKNTFFMSNIRKKLVKYIGIIGLQYALVILELAAFYFLTEEGIVPFWSGVAGLWVVNISLLVLLEVTARRIFGTVDLIGPLVSTR